MIPSQKKIISALGRKNGQSYSELQSSTGLGRATIKEALDRLREKKFVVHDEKTRTYSIKTRENKTLERIEYRLRNIVDNLDGNIEDIKNHSDPFSIGYVLIRSVSYDQTKFQTEVNEPHLSIDEKSKYQVLIELCTMVISKTYEELFKINEEQTFVLKDSLQIANTMPYIEFKTYLKSPKRIKAKQTRQANQIKKFIDLEFPKE